jgi:hypothetical protein
MHRFIENAVLTNAVNAGLATRNEDAPVYADGAPDAGKESFRKGVKDWLRILGLRYFAWEYDLTRYCKEIESLMSYAQEQHFAVLANGAVKIGVCQKVIGVYLKYLWLLGDQSKKPKAPILDSKVLGKANVGGNWTEIETIAQYRDMVDQVEQYVSDHHSDYDCAVVWEAETWTPD